MTSWSLGSPLTGTVLVPVSWILIGGALVGVGRVVGRLASGRWLLLADLDDAACLFWVGTGVTVLLLQLWHLVLPVTGIATLALLAGGWAGLAPGLIRSRPAGREWRHPGAAAAAVFVVLMLWLGNRAGGPLAAYDSGMYHVPAVVWAKAFPVVPGLGNLHGRLAFNDSHFLLAAVLDHGPWARASAHLVSGLLLLPMLVLAVRGVARLLARRAEDPALAAFDAAFLPAIVVYGLQARDVSSLGAELPVLAALAFAVRCVLRSARGGGASSGSASASSRGLTVAAGALAAAAAISFKLTALVVGVGVLLWLVVLGLRDPFLRRTTLVASALAGILGLSWLARGALLSGYPTYPSAWPALPVSWRVPVEQARAERAWIGHFARTIAAPREPWAPLDGPGDWLPSWMGYVVGDRYYRWVFAFPLGLVGLVVPGLFVAHRWRKGASPANGPGPPPGGAGLAWWGLVGLVVGGILLLAVQVPRPEFVAGHLWLLLAIGVGATAAVTGRGRTRPLGGAVALAAAAPLLLPPVLGAPGMADLPGAVAGHVVVSAAPAPTERAGYVPDLERYRTTSGLVLHVPRSDNRCFSAPLPCTPHPAPNLRLRRPGEGLASGFVVEGAWRPRSWPNPWSDFLEGWRRTREGPVGTGGAGGRGSPD